MTRPQPQPLDDPLAKEHEVAAHLFAVLRDGIRYDPSATLPLRRILEAYRVTYAASAG